VQTWVTSIMSEVIPGTTSFVESAVLVHYFIWIGLCEQVPPNISAAEDPLHAQCEIVY
jgi:hypothetical protein